MNINAKSSLNESPPSDTSRILDGVASGERLSDAGALALLQSHDLNRIAVAADAMRKRKHPKNIVTYCVDRNINYTNVCATRCAFCNFSRPADSPEAYILSDDALRQKLKELVACGGTQVLLQGGHHQELKLDYYEHLLGLIRTEFPQVHIHAFSAPEIAHIAHVNGMGIRETIQKLKEFGLKSIPGGGAEILVDRVKKIISPDKLNTLGWLNVHRKAHEEGLRTTATMVFGHVEKLEERVEHLRLLRELQDDTRGFTAFICWTMQPYGTRLDGKFEKAGSWEYLKTVAVSRLYLDNVDNVQTSWVTQGQKVGQTALFYGCNDMGGVMMEENVVRSAGTIYYLDEPECRRLIVDAGFTPVKRNYFYEPL